MSFRGHVQKLDCSWLRGGAELCRCTADKSPFALCSEPELQLKSVWLFVFIALTNLFI